MISSTSSSWKRMYHAIMNNIPSLKDKRRGKNYTLLPSNNRPICGRAE